MTSFGVAFHSWIMALKEHGHCWIRHLFSHIQNMSKYVHKTLFWSTGHTSSDDDIATRTTGGDTLLYLERVQRMVALIWLVSDRYVNVSIQFTMICRAQTPFFFFYIDVRVLTSFALGRPKVVSVTWYRSCRLMIVCLLQFICLVTQVALAQVASNQRDAMLWFSNSLGI